MSQSFEKLIQFLQNKKIEIPQYQYYLQLHENFVDLTHKMQQKKVNLKAYQDYLEMVEGSTLAHSKSHQEILINDEFKKIEWLGKSLLDEGKVTLEDLNSSLQEISLPQLTAISLLQHLLRTKKIRSTDFLWWAQNLALLREISDSPYQIKVDQEIFQFYLPEESRKKIGSYEILGELGRGGMGVVYKAYHPILQQTVALKVLITKRQNQTNALKRFHREAQTMSRLQHLNIIRLIDFAEDQGKLYFVMEYVEGTSLTHCLRHKTLGHRKKIEIICKVLEALHFAHQQGVVHRDLKLDNILLSKNGEPKIADFGLAKILDEENEELAKITRTGAILGTPHYMSPEQARGELDQVDGRSDIYAIAVCLYRLLTAKFPYDSASIPQLFKKITQEIPNPPSTLNFTIHHDLDAILLKALAKNPEDRYQTAKEFAQDLDRFLNGYAIPADPALFKAKKQIWKKQYRFLFGFSFLFIFLFLGWGIIFYGGKYLEQHRSFASYYQEAESLYQKNFVQKEGNITHSTSLQEALNIFNLLNQSLQIKPQHAQTEQLKWNVGQKILAQRELTKSKPFADYVLSQLSELSCVSQTEKDFLKKQWYQKIHKESQREIQRFEQWLSRLQSGPLPLSEYKDVLFEVSRMSEEVVLQKMLALFKEGTLLFTKDFKPLDPPHLEKFYGVIVQILGRSENSKVLPELLHASKTLTFLLTKHFTEDAKRPYDRVYYLILIVEAIANQRSSEHLAFVDKMRAAFGENSIFAIRVKPALKKLVLLAQKENKLVSETSGNLSSRLQQADLMLLSKNYTEAINMYDQILEHYPKSYEVYNQRGLAKRYSGRYIEAIQDFDLALFYNPPNQREVIYYNRGITKRSIGNLKGAIEDILQSIKMRPNFITGYNELGNIYNDLKEYEKALDFYNQGITVNPYHADIYANRANIYIFQKKYEQALKDLQKAIQLNPKKANYYSSLGSLKVKQGDEEGAIACFTEAIHLESKESSYYFNRGNSKAKMKDYDGAILDYNEALTINPKDVEVYANRGMAYLAKKETTLAYQDFCRAIILDPKLKEMYYFRGQILFDLQRYEEAIHDFLNALQFGLKNAQTLLYLSRCYESLQKREEALKYANEAILLAPQLAETYHERGLILLRMQQQLELAKEDFDQVLRLNPKLMSAYFNRGRVQELLQYVSEAIDDYTNYIHYHPAYDETYYYRGGLYLKQQKRNEAKKDFKEYLQKTQHKKTPEILQAHQRIFKIFPELEIK